MTANVDVTCRAEHPVEALGFIEVLGTFVGREASRGLLRDPDGRSLCAKSPCRFGNLKRDVVASVPQIRTQGIIVMGPVIDLGLQEFATGSLVGPGSGLDP